MAETYILRARVIDGSIPILTETMAAYYPDLTENNFEIIATYNKENFMRLYEIGKEAWVNGDLSKFEILGWAGGVNNHNGNRFIWMFRPDLYNFEEIPQSIMEAIDNPLPKPLSSDMRTYYNRLWKPLKYGFSLATYEALIQNQSMPSLQLQIDCAKTRTVDRLAVHSPNIEK